MGFSENLKKYRKEKGMSQAELARKAGVSEISIRKYENNERSPKLETRIALASALGVPFNDLNGGMWIDEKTGAMYGESEITINKPKKSETDLEADLFKKEVTLNNNITFHLNKSDFTEKELEDILAYIEFIESKRLKKTDK